MSRKSKPAIIKMNRVVHYSTAERRRKCSRSEAKEECANDEHITSKRDSNQFIMMVSMHCNERLSHSLLRINSSVITGKKYDCDIQSRY